MHRQYCPRPIPAPATSSTMQLHPRNCPERSRPALLQMPQENRVHVQEMPTGLCPNPLPFFFSRHPGLGEARGSPHRTAIGYPMPRFPDLICSVGRTSGSKESLGSIASCRCTDASRAIDSAAVASICYNRTLQGTPHPITPPEVDFTIYHMLLVHIQTPSISSPIPGATHPPTHRPRLGRGRPLS
ncbi:hypothetical protein GGI42DRAFT_322884 [Trichoderma sp. SZMC 28013]